MRREIIAIETTPSGSSDYHHITRVKWRAAGPPASQDTRTVQEVIIQIGLGDEFFVADSTGEVPVVAVPLE